MSQTIISVENISKKYNINTQRIGDQEYSSLRVALTSAITLPLRIFSRTYRSNNQRTKEFWALKNVSFEVERGEVIGIIGRNGAGKSTLLKILSQITEPTYGEIRICGRVASLLEIGTGFHPELTGRENVFLNGAILGMSNSETKKKFDEIIDFAEVDAFVDTPVKRYSSGMYLRLAFAVAAHLEPEILLIDEVLAVGDASFQKRCLEKMEGVAKQNRTVLFVSHNMQAIQALCEKVIHIDHGRIINIGDANSVVSHYLSQNSSTQNEILWDILDAPGNSIAKVISIKIQSDKGISKGIYSSKDCLKITFEFIVEIKNSGLCVGFDLVSSDGITLFRSYHTDGYFEEWPELKIGINQLVCTIPNGLLNNGMYYISPKIKIHGTSVWIVNLVSVLQFEIVLDHGISPLWNNVSTSDRPGKIAPILNWKVNT